MTFWDFFFESSNQTISTKQYVEKLSRDLIRMKWLYLDRFGADNDDKDPMQHVELVNCSITLGPFNVTTLMVVSTIIMINIKT